MSAMLTYFCCIVTQIRAFAKGSYRLDLLCRAVEPALEARDGLAETYREFGRDAKAVNRPPFRG